MSHMENFTSNSSSLDPSTDPTMLGNSRQRKPLVPEKRSFIADSWRLLGNSLLISSYVCVNLLILSSIIPIRMPFVHTTFFVAVFLFLYLGLRCRIRATMHRVVNGSVLLGTDHRPPVLYLRTFNDDNIASKISVINARNFFGGLYILCNEFDVATEEQQLATVVSDLGPFISIGRPGERFPKVGSARMYLMDNEWQSIITDLVPRSRLVVLRAGQSDALWWELQTASRLIEPQRFVILVPFGKRRYDRFRKKALTYLPCELPEHSGRKNSFSTIRGLIYFEPDWTPHFVGMDRRYARGFASQNIIPMFQFAFRPVFKQLHVSWRPPSPEWELYDALPYVPRWLLPVLLILCMVYLDIR